MRAWSPYTERGTVIAVISGGSSLGLALGAPAVAWLIATLSWRWSFILTGAVGFVWVVVVWLALVSVWLWLPVGRQETWVHRWHPAQCSGAWIRDSSFRNRP